MTVIAEPPASEVVARQAARLAEPRLKRELDTIGAMLRIHCRDRHRAAATDAGGLCTDCAALFDYARKRLALCPYGSEKPTCVNCQIHCYGKHQRDTVRDVMRYAGPRMIWRHPLLAIAHVVDNRRPAPPKPNAAVSAASPVAPAGAAPLASSAAPASESGSPSPRP